MPPDDGPASTRERLLAATRAELDEHGHAGISLRAVARRAELSHAAPKHHFTDRAGLLTAVATQGFEALTASLAQVPENGAGGRLAALGSAYVDFGLEHPALFDLMFRQVELRADDPGLLRAQAASVEALAAAATSASGRGDPDPDDDPATLTVMAWALVHGLVVLARDGALRDPLEAHDRAPADLARAVVAAFGGLVAGDRA